MTGVQTCALPISALLERGRKHGAAVVLGLQALPQLRDTYGRDAAAALLSQPQTWLVLRTVEPDTARWLESALGHTEIDEVRTSVSMGAHAMRDAVSMSRDVNRRPVVMATQLMGLPSLSGFLKLPGEMDVVQVQYRFSKSKRAPESPDSEPRGVLGGAT